MTKWRLKRAPAGGTDPAGVLHETLPRNIPRTVEAFPPGHRHDAS
jgi:hypothetical protein